MSDKQDTTVEVKIDLDLDGDGNTDVKLRLSWSTARKVIIAIASTVIGSAALVANHYL